MELLCSWYGKGLRTKLITIQFCIMLNGIKGKVNYFSYRYILFVSLCITVSYLQISGGKNLELLVLIALSPIFLFFQKTKTDSADYIMYVMLGLMLLFGLMHSGFRWDTYIYSVCSVLSFVYLKGEIKNGKFPIYNVMRVIRKVICLYAIVLVCQQLCVFVGIPPILCYLYDSNYPWKLPSLSPEPSHLVIFILFLMYTYVLLYEEYVGHRYLLANIKKDITLWIAYFWCMIGSGSTSGLLYVLLIFFRYFKGRTLIITGLIFGLSYILANALLSDSASFQRILNLTSAFLTFDSSLILETDGSAAMRLSPIFYFFNNINILDLGFWCGHGVDSGKVVLSAFMYDATGLGAYNTDEGANMGGLWGFIIDYGIIVFGLFVFALASFMKKIKDKWIVFFYCFLMMFMAFNMQILWFATMMLYMVNHHQQHHSIV